MRRPRIGNQIADALLTAVVELEDRLSEVMEDYDREVSHGYRDEGDLCGSWVKDIRLATAYIRELANWYREKKGVE